MARSRFFSAARDFPASDEFFLKVEPGSLGL